MAYSNKPKGLDSLLNQYLKRLPQRNEVKRGMVLHLWPSVVGEQITRATRDLHFKNGDLIVKMESEVWRHELHMKRFSITKKLNEKVGSKVVKEIIVRN